MSCHGSRLPAKFLLAIQGIPQPMQYTMVDKRHHHVETNHVFQLAEEKLVSSTYQNKTKREGSSINNGVSLKMIYPVKGNTLMLNASSYSILRQTPP